MKALRLIFEAIAWIGYGLVWHSAIVLAKPYELKILFLGLALAFFGMANAFRFEEKKE